MKTVLIPMFAVVEIADDASVQDADTLIEEAVHLANSQLREEGTMNCILLDEEMDNVQVDSISVGGRTPRFHGANYHSIKVPVATTVFIEAGPYDEDDKRYSLEGDYDVVRIAGRLYADLGWSDDDLKEVDDANA